MAERRARRRRPRSPEVLNPSALAEVLSPSTLAEVIEVARLHFEQGLTQEAIATELDIPQSRVFRRLKLAEDAQFVKTTVCPPPLLTLQADLLARLDKKREIHDVRVVPRGAGENSAINADNLGVVGASFLEEIIVPHPSHHLKIAMACGKTLLTLLTRFVARLEQSPGTLRKLKKKEITLYPLNLYWDWKFDYSAAISPSALVIATAVLLGRLGLKVYADTPPPPLSFYRKAELVPDGEQAQLAQKYTEYRQAVEQADIFLLGIGTGDRERSNYSDVVEWLDIDDTINWDSIAGEINYQPYTTDGTFPSLPRFPGVQAKRLQELAKTEKKVIAVAGGIGKASAVRAILKKDAPFNILLTDQDIAEQIRWV